MSTLRTTNLQHASAAAPAIVLASSGSATAQLSSINDGPIAGARNRIINGDMRIDQRNAGASGTASGYTIDRWEYVASQASKGTWQQNAGSVTPPSGFTNYWGFTSSSAYSITATDYFVFRHNIEGYNIADFAFGTANAKTITASFWVRSSLTGTFGGAFANSGYSRSYPFTYSISSANTWEYKTLTISGETTGTWLSTNGKGLSIEFGLGVGSTYSGTGGAWSSNAYDSATGATSVVGTNGATFYITGVQLEPGSVATPFERRSYGQELALCQRYYSTGGAYFDGYGTTANQSIGGSNTQFPVEMRATPTMTYGTISSILNAKVGGTRTTTTLANYRYALAVGGGSVVATESWTASAEL